MRLTMMNAGKIPNMPQQAQAGNAQFQKIINVINNRFKQNNSNFDMVELSSKAKDLLKAEKESPEKAAGNQNSPAYVTRTEADWAESSLTQQLRGVSSVKNDLEYEKERLETILSKMSEYEKIANGEISQKDTFVTRERAIELLGKYKESIKNDFSSEIDSTVKFYNDWAKAYDKFSDGLASKVMKNALSDLSAESLGLNNLSDDPMEIMKALDNAIKNLDGIAKNIEENFYHATGKEKKMSEFDTPADRENTDKWNKEKMDLEIAVIEMAEVDKDTAFTGKTLKIK